MSKAVLISIQPQWCKLIVEGKKTVEVRKNRPKLETPFKCYIYCTLGGHYKRTTQLAEARYFGNGKELSNGKVIGEFVCDEIFPVRVFDNGSIQNWMAYELERACVPYEEVAEYIGWDKTGCGWHISDLVIYDEPIKLSDFGEGRAPQSWCYVGG